MNHKPGPGGFKDPIREAWVLRFGIPVVNDNRFLTDSLCRQLSHCQDDEARRIILGLSR